MNRQRPPDGPKPTRMSNIWDAPWHQILALFIAGWWVGMMMH